MRESRLLSVLRPSLALVALAVVIVLLGLAVAVPAHASSPAPAVPSPTAQEAAPTVVAPVQPASTDLSGAAQKDIVRFGEDYTLPQAAIVPNVVVFGGDITIDGTVTKSVVAFGGNITVNGTVKTNVVAFGGDITLSQTANVGADVAPNTASVVLIGGGLHQAPGAQVHGTLQTVSGLDWGSAAAWFGRGFVNNPFTGFSFVGWLIQTAFFLVLALVAAALMHRQLGGVQRQLAHRPWPSLGWGALIFFVGVPVVLVILIISIVGLLLVIPYAVFILLAYFFVTTAVAAYLAQRIIIGFGGKENLMLSVVVGVVGTTAVSRIPVLGPVLLAIMTVIGVGAAVLGFAAGRADAGRRHHADRADVAGAGRSGLAGGAAAAACGGGGAGVRAARARADVCAARARAARLRAARI